MPHLITTGCAILTLLNLLALPVAPLFSFAFCELVMRFAIAVDLAKLRREALAG